MINLRYIVIERGHRFPADTIRFQASPSTLEDIAEAAAKHWFHHAGNGWEEDWPLTFEVYQDQTGRQVCRFRVDVEDTPTFFALGTPS